MTANNSVEWTGRLRLGVFPYDLSKNVTNYSAESFEHQLRSALYGDADGEESAAAAGEWRMATCLLCRGHTAALCRLSTGRHDVQAVAWRWCGYGRLVF